MELFINSICSILKYTSVHYGEHFSQIQLNTKLYSVTISPCVVLSPRSDTVRYALDLLSILTVVPKTQLLMSESVAVLDGEGGNAISTVGMLHCPALSLTSWG